MVSDRFASGWSLGFESRARTSDHPGFSSRHSNPSSSFSPEAFVRGLLDAPAFTKNLGARFVAELRSLARERDGAFFAAAALTFGSRLEAAGQIDSALSWYAALAPLALPAVPERLARLQGRGAFAGRADLMIGGFVKTATDYRSILPMLAGSAVYQVAKTASLARLASSSGAGLIGNAGSARWGASLTGFLFEVPTFTLAQRGLRALAGESIDASLGRDLFGSALTLGALKLSAWAGSSLGAALPLPRRFPLAAVSQFAGLWGARRLETAAGLHSSADGGSGPADILASMISLGVGSHLGHRVLGTGFARFQVELNGRWNGSLPRPGSRISPAAFQPFFPQAVAALAPGGGVRESRPLSFIKPPLMMMEKAGESSASGPSQEVLEALMRGTDPATPALIWLRQRFLDWAKAGGVSTAQKRVMMLALADVKRYLSTDETGAPHWKNRQAWDRLQDLAAELDLDLADFLRPELPAPPPQPQVMDLAAAVKPISAAPDPAPLPDETFERRSERIERELANLKRRLDLLEIQVSPDLEEMYLKSFEEIERVHGFLRDEAKTAADPVRRKGARTRAEVERFQTDLLDRIVRLNDGLGSASWEGEASPRWRLRPYQKEILASLDRDLQSEAAPWLGVASPMQTGKSYLIGPIIQLVRRQLGPNTRFIVLSSAKVITEQVQRDLLAGFPPSRVGRFDGLVKNFKPITVASVFSLAPHLAEFPPEENHPVVLINDEAYFTQAPLVQRIYEHFGLAAREEGKGDGDVVPKRGNGLVMGLSGTGAGLKGYRLSGQLDLLGAIEQGWVREMEGERIVLKLASDKKSGADGEKMIWWAATPENARELAAIYGDKIRGKYPSSLTFVPTIEHGRLFEAAMAEAYGEGTSRMVHSQMSEGEYRAAMTAFQSGGNLTSVQMLSRGFRGTGTGAVFHTYQSSSAELVAQRTGRAWGGEEGKIMPDLYVLEAAWSERDAFATLARLCGLVEAPLRRFSTRGLRATVEKIRRRKEWEGERTISIERGEAAPYFNTVPLTEAWRRRFRDVMKAEGGAEALTRKSGLAAEVTAGLALGSLPTRWADLLRLAKFLGGEENARAIWVEGWEEAVADILEGKATVTGALEKKLLAWNRAGGELGAKAEALDRLLGETFHPLPKPKRLSGSEQLLAGLRSILPQESEENLQVILAEEAALFLENLREKPEEAAIFRSKFWEGGALPAANEEPALPAENASRTDTRRMMNKFLLQVERNRLYGKDPRSIPIRLLGLSPRYAERLEASNYENLGQLADLTVADLMKIKNVARAGIKEIRQVLAEHGMKLRNHDVLVASRLLPGVKLPKAPLDPRELFLDDLQFSRRLLRIFNFYRVNTLGDLAEFSAAELLTWKNFGRVALRAVIGKLAKHGLELKKNPEEADSDPLNLRIQELDFPPAFLALAKRKGLVTLRHVVELSPNDLLRFSLSFKRRKADRAESLPPVSLAVLSQVKEVLAKHGLELRKEEIPPFPALDEAYDVSRNAFLLNDFSVRLPFFYRGDLDGYPSYVFGYGEGVNVFDSHFEPFGRFLISRLESGQFYIPIWTSDAFEIQEIDGSYPLKWDFGKVFFRPGGKFLLVSRRTDHMMVVSVQEDSKTPGSRLNVLRFEFRPFLP